MFMMPDSTLLKDIIYIYVCVFLSRHECPPYFPLDVMFSLHNNIPIKVLQVVFLLCISTYCKQ